MPDPAYVSPGDKIRPTASDHNAFVDAARFAHRFPGTRGPGDGIAGIPPDCAAVRVVNNTDKLIEIGCPVTLGKADTGGSTEFKPTDTYPVPSPLFSAAAPNSGSGSDWYAGITAVREIGITTTPLNPGGVGWAAVRGVCSAKIVIQQGQVGSSWASVVDGEQYMHCTGAGTHSVLWRDPAVTAGPAWAMVSRQDAPFSVGILHPFTRQEGLYIGAANAVMRSTDYTGLPFALLGGGTGGFPVLVYNIVEHDSQFAMLRVGDTAIGHFAGVYKISAETDSNGKHPYAAVVVIDMRQPLFGELLCDGGIEGLEKDEYSAKIQRAKPHDNRFGGGGEYSDLQTPKAWLDGGTEPTFAEVIRAVKNFGDNGMRRNKGARFALAPFFPALYTYYIPDTGKICDGDSSEGNSTTSTSSSSGDGSTTSTSSGAETTTSGGGGGGSSGSATSGEGTSDPSSGETGGGGTEPPGHTTTGGGSSDDRHPYYPARDCATKAIVELVFFDARVATPGTAYRQDNAARSCWYFDLADTPYVSSGAPPLAIVSHPFDTCAACNCTCDHPMTVDVGDPTIEAGQSQGTFDEGTYCVRYVNGATNNGGSTGWNPGAILKDSGGSTIKLLDPTGGTTYTSQAIAEAAAGGYKDSFTLGSSTDLYLSAYDVGGGYGDNVSGGPNPTYIICKLS